MKISYNWLKEYIDVNLPIDEVSELLTDTGLEVEGVEVYETVKGGLSGVVVGSVLECTQHANADRLKVTRVDVGNNTILQIVCGAPNVAQGQKVLVATIGTELYTEEGDSFKIKKGKIRGEVSEGMICAEDELGLGHSHEGILVLNTNAVPGTPAAQYFDVKNDEVIEIGLTPNRTDAMSHFGVARDLSAALLRKEIKTNTTLPSVTTFVIDGNTHVIPVAIENTEACGHYFGLTISNVTVKESPDWLKHRLLAIGIKPTNNVVDVTNFVMHEVGHPLHAFDASEIQGNKVKVRNAIKGEKFTTLDGKVLELDQADLMIANAKESMCIAGVYGGQKSGVKFETTDVFLEAAWFNPVSVRKTARRHGLNTDASFRYERGVDPEMTEYALKRAAILIRDLTEGQISSDIQKEIVQTHQEAEIDMSFNRINQLIGQEISKDDVHSILRSLDIQLLAEGTDKFRVKIPLYRVDVTREADVIEEILRIYGLNNVEMPGKLSFTMHNINAKSSTLLKKKVNNYLVANGYTEIQNNSLTKASYYQNNLAFAEAETVKILNPLSNDLSVMRRTLLFGGLEVIKRNINHKSENLRLVEMGKSYAKIEGEYQELEWVGFWKTGKEQLESWSVKSAPSSFFTLKSDVLDMLKSFGVKNTREEVRLNAAQQEELHLLIGDRTLAIIRNVNDNYLKMFDISQPVYYAEVAWSLLLKSYYRSHEVYKEIDKYPSVRRDLALLVDHEVSYADLERTAIKNVKNLLKSVNLFDVYQGKNLPEGKKSYGLSFVLQDSNKTLNDKQVDGVMNKLIKIYNEQFSAELR